MAKKKFSVTKTDRRTERRVKFSEKRMAQRLNISMSIVYKVRGKCSDISGKGIKMSTVQPLTPGSQVEIVIPKIVLDAMPFTALTKVVWSRQAPGGKFEAGLSFIKIKKREQFMQFLCEKMIDLSLDQKTQS